MNLTRNLDHYPEPLVQGVGRKVILGGAHGVVAAAVLIHQTITMLEGLDPLGEPGERQVLPRQAGLRQLADPPYHPCQRR